MMQIKTFPMTLTPKMLEWISSKKLLTCFPRGRD